MLLNGPVIFAEVTAPANIFSVVTALGCIAVEFTAAVPILPNVTDDPASLALVTVRSPSWVVPIELSAILALVTASSAICAVAIVPLRLDVG